MFWRRVPRRSRGSRSTRPWSAGGSSIAADVPGSSFLVSGSGLGTGKPEPGTPRSSSRLAALVLYAFLAAAAARAHELGTIRVVARFHRDGAFAIDAIVDRQHLPPGFGTAARIDP